MEVSYLAHSDDDYSIRPVPEQEAYAIRMHPLDGSLSEIGYIATGENGVLTTCDDFIKNDINGEIKCNTIGGLPFYLYEGNNSNKSNSVEIYNKVLSSIKIK